MSYMLLYQFNRVTSEPLSLKSCLTIFKSSCALLLSVIFRIMGGGRCSARDLYKSLGEAGNLHGYGVF